MPPALTVRLHLRAPEEIQQQLREHAGAVDALIRPLEVLSPDERAAIGADAAAASLASIWSANDHALRVLLPALPPVVRCLPSPQRDSHPCPSISCSTGGDTGFAAPSAGYNSLDQLIAHLARDWSAWGAGARRATHRPLLHAIQAHSRRQRWKLGREAARLRVLVPGAGCCRLAWEIARRGHSVEACDVAEGMLLAAHTIITSAPTRRRHASAANRTGAWGGDPGAPPLSPVGKSVRLFPFARCGGVLRRRACLQPATIPDVSHRTLAASSARGLRLTLQSADFLTFYGANGGGQQTGWDIISTSYVLDCFSDPSAAIRRVSKLLVRGGRWLNVGPLQWHAPAAGMLQLSWDELRPLLELYNLTVYKWRVVRRVPYLTHPGGRAALLAAADQWHDVLFFEAVRQ
jgi:hypothetical protein